MSSRNIIVTGSQGFVARYLIPLLQGAGNPVSGIDKAPGLAPCPTVLGNILDIAKVRDALRGKTTVIHLAAEHKDFGLTEAQYFEVNERGTAILTQVASEFQIKEFIFYSSVAVYGTHDHPVTEDEIPKPINPYGASKLAAEKVLERWAAEDPSRKVVIIRPTVVFGAHNRANMYRWITLIQRGLYLPVGDGKNIKSVAYVENLVAATAFLLNRMTPGLRIYNYADEPNLSTAEMYTTLAGLLGRPRYPFSLPLSPILALGKVVVAIAGMVGLDLASQLNRVRKLNANSHFVAAKLREVGFVPPFTLTEGLERTIRWFTSPGRDRKVRDDIKKAA